MTPIQVGIDQSLELIQDLDFEFAPPCEAESFHDPVNFKGTVNVYLGPVEEAKWRIAVHFPICGHHVVTLRCQKCRDYMMVNDIPVLLCLTCETRNPGPVRQLITSINPIK